MKSVKVYSTASCVYCKMVKDFFNKNNIKYEEHDVYNNETARKELVDKSGQMGVPVMDIDGEIVIGFDKPKLMKILGIN